MEDKSSSKSLSLNLSKLLVFFIKIYPIVNAIGYFIVIILHYFDIEARLIDYIVIQTFMPLILLYMLSVVFKFCLYHRIFIHYMLIETIISLLDETYGIPITDKHFLYLQSALLFITLLIALFSYMKKNNVKILRK